MIWATPYEAARFTDARFCSYATASPTATRRGVLDFDFDFDFDSFFSASSFGAAAAPAPPPPAADEASVAPPPPPWIGHRAAARTSAGFRREALDEVDGCGAGRSPNPSMRRRSPPGGGLLPWAHGIAFRVRPSAAAVAAAVVVVAIAVVIAVVTAASRSSGASVMVHADDRKGAHPALARSQRARERRGFRPTKPRTPPASW